MGTMREAMLREMALRGFAPRTQETYVNWMGRLVSRTRVVADQLTEVQVRTYLASLSQRGLSASTLNQAISAIRFFFNAALHREWPLELVYQRAPQRVPVKLSREEVGRLLAAVPGLRERAAMEIAYGAGLRLNEVLNLRVADIDSDLMILRVDQGKGRKDRNVMLSPALLETLRAYWKQSRSRGWLFPGHRGKKPLHPTILQRAFQRAKQEARITKPVSFGFQANGCRRRLIARARQLLQIPASPQPDNTQRESWRDLYRRLTGRDLTRCPYCGNGTLRTVALAPPDAHERGP